VAQVLAESLLDAVKEELVPYNAIDDIAFDGRIGDALEEFGLKIMEGIANYFGPDIASEVSENIMEQLPSMEFSPEVNNAIESSMDGILDVNVEEPTQFEVDGVNITNGVMTDSVTGALDVGSFSSDNAASFAVDSVSNDMNDYIDNVDLASSIEHVDNGVDAAIEITNDVATPEVEIEGLDNDNGNFNNSEVNIDVPTETPFETPIETSEVDDVDETEIAEVFLG